MRKVLPIALLALAMSACAGSSSGTSGTPTTVANLPPHVTPRTAGTSTAPAGPTPTVALSADYSGFLHSVCTALGTRNASTLTGTLPYYQYNSGVRYGTLGDGEGQTGDPSLLSTWVQNSHITCRYFTPDQAGHGTVLTSGWTRAGGWSLIEMDTYNGNWKINDFTFGTRDALSQAMQTSHPIVAYNGR